MRVSDHCVRSDKAPAKDAVVRGGKMAPSLKCLPHGHEVMSSDPWHPRKNWGACVHCKSSTGEEGGKDKKISESSSTSQPGD